MQEDKRYHRIEEGGIDVTRLAQLNIMIKVDNLHSDHLRYHPLWPLCRGLRAVGVRHVFVAGNTRYLESLNNEMRDIGFTQSVGAWINPDTAPDMSATDILVDLTNSFHSKQMCDAIATASSTRLISIWCGNTWIRLGRGIGAPEAAYGHGDVGVHPESPVLPVSRVAAGLVLQEILLAAGLRNNDTPADADVTYNAADDSLIDLQTSWPDIHLDDTTIDVAGAGGTGVHFLESFVPLLSDQSRLRIFDPDEVGMENLAMQIAYRADDVGRPKAVVMAEQLQSYCDATIEPFVVEYQRRPNDLTPPDLRVLCPDNYEARKLANDASLTDAVPLVDSGSSPMAGRVETYYPGRTACLEHRLARLAERAATEHEPECCGKRHDATLPGTNMVIGGLAACEAVRALKPDTYGWPSMGSVIYDARFASRIGLTPPRPACEHGVVGCSTQAK